MSSYSLKPLEDNGLYHEEYGCKSNIMDSDSEYIIHRKDRYSTTGFLTFYAPKINRDFYEIKAHQM